MAHLIRPWIYRHVKDGKRVPPGTPGARVVKERARKWYGKGIPGLPKNKKVPLASDKAAALQLLAGLVKKAERGEAGLWDSVREANQLTLEQHLAGFERHLRNKPRSTSEKQVKLLGTRLRAAFAGCGFQYPADLDAAKVLDYLAERRGLPTAEGGLSIQTSNFYLSALNQFCRWMCRVRPPRMTENPFAGVERGNVKLDRRHDRRNLAPEELGKLLDATKDSPRVFRGLTGEDRYWLYLTGCSTGFRARELATLTPESFRLDALPAAVTLPARTDKAKRPIVQPLPAFVAEGLRAYLAGKPGGGPIWPGTTTRGWLDRAAGMLAKDLADGGIPYVVKGPDGPLYADFHALRHSFITFLEHTGASPKTAQELARPSDVRITLGRYTHANLAGLAEAVERLPLPGNDQGGLPSYGQLLEAVALYRAVIAMLVSPVVPLVVPDDGAQGDRGEPAGTEAGGDDAAGHAA